MKTHSTNHLHAEFDKHIALTEAYSEIKGLAFLIKACRLKPYAYLNDHDKDLILHRLWIDEFGNSLEITKRKKLKIILGDLKIKNKIICSDLYYGLSINRIIKMSKFMYFCVGKDDSLFQDCCILSLLGIDNYFRTYLYINEEWTQVSTLLLGTKYLKLLTKSLLTKRYRIQVVKKNLPIPCEGGNIWLTSLPATKTFLKELKRHEFINNLTKEI
jgi:hypothetical protein